MVVSVTLPTEVGWLLCVAVEAAGAAAEEVEEERGVSGSGHTSSCTSCGQYILMELYKYHCRSRERPEGGTTGGSCC